MAANLQANVPTGRDLSLQARMTDPSLRIIVVLSSFEGFRMTSGQELVWEDFRGIRTFAAMGTRAKVDA